MHMHRKAFSLIELLIAISVSSILVAITISTYGLFRRGIAQDNAKAQLSQNGRVALDRISREVRVTPQVITQFPDNAADPSPIQPHEIEFQDGFLAISDPSYLTYHRYWLSGTILMMDVKEYVFTSNPGVRVLAGSTDGGGNPPVSNIISSQAIALSVTSLIFYGAKPLEIDLTTSDVTGQSYFLRTTVSGRNI